MRAVLFDLFGTLLTYGEMQIAWTEWRRVMGLYGSRLGFAMGERELSVDLDGFFNLPAPSEPEDLTVYERRLREWAIRHGVQPDPTWCRALADHSLEVWQRQVECDPQAIPLLEALRAKGLRIGVLTNFDHPPHVHHLLDSTGIGLRLDSIVISGEVALKKPDARIFELAASQLGCEPSECLFVGDNPEQDIQGALGVSMIAVLLKRGQGINRLHTDYRSDMANGKDQSSMVFSGNTRVVSTLTELIPLVESLE